MVNSWHFRVTDDTVGFCIRYIDPHLTALFVCQCRTSPVWHDIFLVGAIHALQYCVIFLLTAGSQFLLLAQRQITTLVEFYECSFQVPSQ
mmetsp:Transcript_44405/g.74769  ORF Transcript_44405/g.74769 Transcript_44405/m.74769 type:complete len:90 (-) Transcript_44405:117-386(-)